MQDDIRLGALHHIDQSGSVADIDLVVLDIEMPDMDGYQVCTWLRSEQFSQRFSNRNKNVSKWLQQLLWFMLKYAK